MQYTRDTKTVWQSIVERFRRKRSGERPEVWKVILSDAGISIRRDSVLEFRGCDELWAMSWSDVERVTASKKDSLTYDTIWISMFDSVGRQISFPDDADGFTSAAEALPRYLTGCLGFEDWFSDVAFPVFVENWTEIYPVAAA